MAGSDSTEQARRLCLAVLHSGDRKIRGRILPIEDTLCIGRAGAEEVDLGIEDRLLSRRHASLSLVGTSDKGELIDHDSRNGSFVDGVRVERALLSEGAIIRLGVSVFELTFDARDALPDVGRGQRDRLIGPSAALEDVVRAIEELAKTDERVLILGASGAGKTLAASEIHRASGCPGAIVFIGCRGAGSPLRRRDFLGTPEEEGFFASAEGGTLVFEEIDLLLPELQELVLETLSEGTFRPEGDEQRPLNARIISTTSANLSAAVAVGAFDEALHEQLRGRVVELPALHQRRSDIPFLVRHFLALEEPGRDFDWSATFIEKLLLYDWPSNARELRAVVRRLTMVEDDVKMLRSAHLPKEIRKGVKLQSEDALRASAISYQTVPSRDELSQLLERFEGDVQRVAEHYDKDRRNVYRWLMRHDLSAGDYRK